MQEAIFAYFQQKAVKGICFIQWTLLATKTTTMKIREAGLIIGIVLIFLSFLFFARAPFTYTGILVGGLLVSGIFYLSILFGKRTVVNKSAWTLICIGAYLILTFVEPLIIKSSYLIYLHSNQTDLEEINSLVSRDSAEVWIGREEIIDKQNKLSSQNQKRLLELRQKVGAYSIVASKEGVYYGLDGFLDVRHGVLYSTINSDNRKGLKPLKDSWYYQ
ncbi:hypothetical protein D770_04260 [Flammeovirgaceae bacterium 311]|nr:hypothetical protein D770_04260 [Flammeovirgaceae bacterium 311]